VDKVSDILEPERRVGERLDVEGRVRRQKRRTAAEERRERGRSGQKSGGGGGGGGGRAPAKAQAAAAEGESIPDGEARTTLVNSGADNEVMNA